MITLRPMTESDYQRLRAAIFENYARETASVRSISIEEGRAAASRQFDDLLPDGIASQGHHFWRITDGVAGDVGDLWVFVDSSKQQAFVYFIGIDEPHRGHSYSKAAMLALEATVKPLGATHIDLNVFGDNTTAIHLYESLGYQPTAMNMRKEI